MRLQRQAFELRRRANDRGAELAAGVQLAALVGGVTGYAGVETSLMDRIDELAAELGRTDLTIFLRWSRWAAVDQAGDLETSRKLASELRDLAEHSDDPLVRQYGRQAWAIYCWHTGRIAEAISEPDKTALMNDLIAEGTYYGMPTFDQHLVALIRDGAVTLEAAMAASTNPHDLTVELRRLGLVA